MRELLLEPNKQFEYLKNEKAIVFANTNFDVHGAAAGKDVQAPKDLEIAIKYVLLARRTFPKSEADFISPKWDFTVFVPTKAKTMFPTTIVQNATEAELFNAAMGAGTATNVCWTYEGEFQEVLPPPFVIPTWIVLKEGEHVHLKF